MAEINNKVDAGKILFFLLLQLAHIMNCEGSLDWNNEDEVLGSNITRGRRSEPPVIDSYYFYKSMIRKNSHLFGTPPQIIIDGTAQEVESEISFISIADVDEIKMQYEATFLLKQSWFDPRFQFIGRPEEYIVSHVFDRLKLWKPDTYFLTEREALRHDNSIDNISIMFLPSGIVQYIQKLTMTMDCQMKLHRFPLDTQECEVEISSYALTKAFVIYKWAKQPSNSNNKPVDGYKNIQLAEFKITDVKTTEHDLDRFTGVYSMLKMVLVMERQMSYYWLQVYIPSGLVVMLSWVSFYIDQGAVPARISLGLLTILTLTTQIYGINSQLPRVSYIKAIDVWMLLCLLMVIAAMFEFCLVHVLAREIRIGINTGTIYPGHPNFPGYVDPNEETIGGLKGYWITKFRRYKRKPPLFVDAMSRLLFPCFFMILNFVYWIYYVLIFSKNPE